MTTNDTAITATITAMQAILMGAGYDLADVDGDYEYNFAWTIVDEGVDINALDAADIFAQVSAD